MQIIITFGLLFIILAISLFVSYKVKQKRIKKIGIAGEKKVQKKLDFFCILKDYKVINDIYLPLYDKTTQIDHILIGRFGVIIIETKNYSGDIYGDFKKQNWTQIIGNDKNKLYNPIMQNQTHIDNIRNIFNKENIYNVNVDGLVVFPATNVNLFVPKKLNVIKLRKLKKVLNKTRYIDKGVDIDKVYNAIIKYQVNDKQLLNNHNKNVKKMSKGKI